MSNRLSKSIPWFCSRNIRSDYFYAASSVAGLPEYDRSFLSPCHHDPQDRSTADVAVNNLVI